jgi:transposase
MPAHSKTAKPSAQIAVIGIDIGKNVFHLIGLDKSGAIVLKAKLSRSQLESRLANTPPCLIGMEVCVGAHHVSRRLIALGHDARLMLKALIWNGGSDGAQQSPISEGHERSPI